MAGTPFPATVILGEIKYPGKVNNVVRLDTGWRVEIHLSNIRLRSAPLIEDIRQDGGMIDAGLERLRSLGRLPSFMSTAPDQATTAPAAAVEVTRRRGTALQVAQTLESHPSDGYTMAGYIDKVLRPLRPPLSVGRKTLFNILSGIAREQPAPGKPPLWRGKSSGPDRPPSGRR